MQSLTRDLWKLPDEVRAVATVIDQNHLRVNGTIWTSLWLVQPSRISCAIIGSFVIEDRFMSRAVLVDMVVTVVLERESGSDDLDCFIL